MYDAVSPASIPAGVPPPGYVLGYVDGEWPSYDALVARWPSAVPAAISTIPGSPATGRAQGCDGEAGDYSPAQAAHFAATKLVLGFVPFIYCSWAEWHDYQAACTAVGVSPEEVDWGIAAYPGIGPILYPGTVFHQFVDHGAYDESVVRDGWIPGRTVIVPPSPVQEAPMPVSQAVSFKPAQTDVFQVSFGTLWHKWLTGGQWQNEPLTGPFSVNPYTRAVKVPDQTPEVAVVGTQCIVTIEDASGRAWYLAQDQTMTEWGANELP